jgi:putative membrane protein
MSLRGIAAATACAAALLLTTGGPAWGAAAPSEQDTAFLQAAHQSNLAEIATGNQAQQKAQSQAVKDFGAQLVTDHTRLDQALQQVATTLNVDLPDAPNEQQQAAAARLEAASGEEYDALWISTQLEGHAKAMADGEKEIADGSDQTVIQLARDAAPVIMGHHETAEQIARDLGVPTGVDSGTGGLFADRSPVRAPALALIGAGILLVLAGGFVLRARATR